MCRAFGVRERRSRLDLAQQRDCTPCSPSNYSRSTALKHEHGVHWCTPFNPLSVEEWRKSGAARRAQLHAVLPFLSRGMSTIEDARRAPLHAVHLLLVRGTDSFGRCTACTLPDPAATIKREGGGKRKEDFSQLDFPQFLPSFLCKNQLPTSSRAQIEDLKELPLKDWSQEWS